MRRSWTLGWIAAVVAFSATACGTTAPPRTGAVPPTGRISSPSQSASIDRPAETRLVDARTDGFTVGYGEWAVAPETRTVRPGSIMFVAHNGGRLHHGFELKSESEGSHSGSHGGGRFELESPLFGPGQTVRLRTTLAIGTYELACYVDGHEERGMRTTITVRQNAPLQRVEAPASDIVRIRGFAFAPAGSTVGAGTTVRWSNADPAEHTVTALDGSFGSDPLAPGASFSWTFETPGIFRYHCLIHPSMRGSVVVTS